MVVKNDKLDLPHGNTTVWRYMSLEKFLDLVTTKSLFFSNAAKMTDQYESQMPFRNIQYRVNQLSLQGYDDMSAKFTAQMEATEINKLRELTLLNCWTINQHESYALWKIYLGGSKSGIAVKTKVSKLIKSINNANDSFQEDIFYSKVKYSNFIIDDPNDRFKVTTTKSKSYEYENELRLFIFHYPNSEGGINPPYNIKNGRTLKINLADLIDEIYISPFSGNWFNNSFQIILEKIDSSLAKKIKFSEIRDA